MNAPVPCVRCGRRVARLAANRHRPRALSCARCRYLVYDYPRVACGVLVLKGDDLLLLRRAAPPQVGRIDIPGGFLDAGEGFAAAARRELREETGLRVGPMALLGHYWDHYTLPGFGRFPTLNVYYAARWSRGTPVGADDAASAEWVPLSRLPRLKRQFAWAHMPVVLDDLSRWRRRGGPQAPLAAERPFARRAERPRVRPGVEGA